MQRPTLGASYTLSPRPGQGTKLGRSMSNELERPDAWTELRAIVIPMCGGKSTYAMRFGGYDIDDITVNSGELSVDAECDEMLGLREDAVWHGQFDGLIKHNEILLRRARRFFTLCSPDSNPMFLFVHTAELADALGVPIEVCVELDDQLMTSSSRLSKAEPGVKMRTLRIARDQASANRLFMARAGLGQPRKIRSYFELDALLAGRISRLLPSTPETNKLQQLVMGRMHERVRLDGYYAHLKMRNIPAWSHAVAARNLLHALGDAAPQEAHHHHNHPGWARYIHGVYSCVPQDLRLRLDANPRQQKPSEDKIREAFPLGPGSAAFALFNISDWLARTPDADWDSGWRWAKQLMARPNGATYERLAATLVMGDVLSYVKPQYAELCYRMPLGYLSTSEFSVVTQYAHALVRSGCNYLGEKLPQAELAIFTYWHCLVGRHHAKLDLEKEIADRTHMRTPKYWYYEDGRRSSTEFSNKLRAAITKAYHYLASGVRDKLLNMEDTIASMEDFLKARKSWVKPGSATGSPKTDLFLKTVEITEAEAEELGAEVLDASLMVIRKLRLNKAATFEFPEFPNLVSEALTKFEPNSFTRYFTKFEVGKLEGRALFPSNMLHYVVTSYVLYLAEKAGEIPNSRLNAPTDQQVRDHWVWLETREYMFGLMLDYANFNEQHEIEHMQMVISELKYLYASTDILNTGLEKAIDWVVKSFEHITFEHDGKKYKFNHGLLSGWRCTTWINSVLNVAYMDVISQQVRQLTGLKVLTSLQTGGDDVAAETAKLYDAVVVLRVGEAMGFEFKAIKQLMGGEYREFFRLFVGQDGVRGSLCRMLGSAVSGQWSNSVLAKFVEPASKLSSIVEIARKAGRRCELNLNLMEKMTLCAFDKWAKHDDVRIADELIHGTTATGGLGVPTAQGDVYELELEHVPQREDAVTIIGLPHDASDDQADKICSGVREIMGDDAAVAPNQIAKRMSESVFKGAIATARGPRLAQRIARSVDYRRKPRVKRVKSIRAPDVKAKHNTTFRQRVADYANLIKAYAKARKRFEFLRPGVQDKYAVVLAERIAEQNPGVQPEKLYLWCETLTLYGCATYMLTEDYYEMVVIIALIEAVSATDDNVSRLACAYAKGLSEGGFTLY
uniref:RNA-directed RNA polymerase n=1 Tax=Baoding Chrys tick virus 1 TaxID=2972086 RepID=A0A9E7V1S6_9VIRU|nr:MAG: 127 kDa protein [Baoding Chrys tick virus 1]